MPKIDKKNKKKLNLRKLIMEFVFFSLILAIVAIIIIMIMAPSEHLPNDPYGKVKSDYVLMLLQCILGVFAMMLPSFLEKKVNLEIPSNMMILYTIFLYCAIFLGEVRGFYYNVKHWDTILHTFSGAMLGCLAFSVINFLNKDSNKYINLSPLFVAVFAFCFAVTLGVVWEICEFSADGILNTNMQKFALETGEKFIGRDALKDTMKDLMVDMLGALVISIIGYISLRDKKGWVERLQISHQNK